MICMHAFETSSLPSSPHLSHQNFFFLNHHHHKAFFCTSKKKKKNLSNVKGLWIRRSLYIQQFNNIVVWSLVCWVVVSLVHYVMCGERKKFTENKPHITWIWPWWYFTECTMIIIIQRQHTTTHNLNNFSFISQIWNIIFF
jgi:hypothetical protein